MITFLYKENGRVHMEKVRDSISDFGDKEIIGIDLESPTPEERKQVESQYNIKLLSWQKAEEIESSSRYFETDDTIIANSNYMKMENGRYDYMPVSFIIKHQILFSYHYDKVDSFKNVYSRLQAQSVTDMDGYDLFLLVLDVRIDYDADLLEAVGRSINQISKKIRIDRDLDEESILQITQLQEATMLLRENIMDKQRVMSAILKSERFVNKKEGRLRIMLKDTGSLLEHTAFSFERLEFLQDTLMGLIDIEQNKIIKMFSVVAVVFMPPTLIASMYGMNFRIMPELSWSFGYPFAIVLMLASSVLTLWYFHRKGWL
ncbi:magnesium/cobalt transporter CorA [Prolixibacter sp. NT017]|uniref:magnesium/cobalt transporter CorA n=1 Tax=Prolixibacter sp. NT017 TaxID=2652390 RepID=UPI0012764EDC|nr:magnesium/cobalt transporter CorA [Prolixibacter sp. NT017]GET24832.1 magnesium transport protein CorA [Prolixibacter sp. NT017]